MFSFSVAFSVASYMTLFACCLSLSFSLSARPMVGAHAMETTMSSSCVTPRSVPKILPISGKSSARCGIHTSSTRGPNTSGCRMSILTVRHPWHCILCKMLWGNKVPVAYLDSGHFNRNTCTAAYQCHYDSVGQSRRRNSETDEDRWRASVPWFIIMWNKQPS